MPKRPPIRPIFSEKPNKNVYDYWDAKTQQMIKCAGFQIDIRDNTSGKRIRRNIKADYQTAKAAYDELREMVQDANVSVPTLIKHSKVRTLGDLLRVYERAKSDPSLKNRQVRSPLTIERVKVSVKGFRGAFGGDPELKSITSAKIERYIKIRLDQGRKHGGINTDLRMLKALFNWALKREYVVANPFLAVELFPNKGSGPRPLTPAELERFFQFNPPGSRWYPLLMVYLLTGARLSEILKPKFSWQDVDFKNETITLAVRKGHKESELPLNTLLLEIFKELRRKPYRKEKHHQQADDKDYPFPFTHWYVSHKVKVLMQEAGIKATAHDLRDSFVSYLIYLGYPLEDVSKIAGHSSIQVTERHYYRQLEERKRIMVDELGDYIAYRAGLPKTVTKNSDKTRSTVTDPDLLEEFFGEAKKPASPIKKSGFSKGTPGGTRTHDRRLRRPLLYPAELPGLSAGKATTPPAELPTGKKGFQFRPGLNSFTVTLRLSASIRT